MLNYTELPADGILLEQLVREMLIRTGFGVHWTGVGPDGGRDMVATETALGVLAPFSRKWLVSCKHKAHGGGSVGIEDVRDITDACAAVDASGFLLVCSTQPSASVVRRLEEVEGVGRLKTRFWDGIEIERRLDVPELFPLRHRFFPKSAAASSWRIYNTGSPSFWAANYNDYFLYLSSRIAHAFPALSKVEQIAARLDSIELPGMNWTRHILRLRGVYYDDKHEQFSIFVDYLYPKSGIADVVTPKALNAVLETGMGLQHNELGMAYLAHWDVRYVEADPGSDRFHEDAKHYYEPYMDNFRHGMTRDGWLDEIDAPQEIEAYSAPSRLSP
ncbi:Uncharacterised protein [Brevundimonas diminuta]|uniref:restriction endonuclease n=1 Tax=Brevundimonas diminuta TaxID=293 RepID=UPI000D867561|nr:restriction endonuclease [Brevundimonas diminuta]SPU44580.1 Uncharacterised protein [Brevundimonas diminuta]